MSINEINIQIFTKGYKFMNTFLLFLIQKNQHKISAEYAILVCT